MLPNVLGAGLSLAGIVLVYFFLEETVDVHNGSDRYLPRFASTVEMKGVVPLFLTPVGIYYLPLLGYGERTVHACAQVPVRF